MAPENKDFFNDLSEIRRAEENIRNNEAKSEIVGQIFGMGGRREVTGYKWLIQKEFEQSVENFLSDYISPESFLKKVTGGPGYTVPSMDLLEEGVGLMIQDEIKVKQQPIQKEYYDIVYTGSNRYSMILAQMVSMTKEGLEKIFGYKFEELISEFPEYFEIKELDENEERSDPYFKFISLRNMPHKEQNSFLKDADSRYYFLISLESNKKSHPALKALLDTLNDIRDREVLSRR